jgi:hypothetical protein
VNLFTITYKIMPHPSIMPAFLAFLAISAGVRMGNPGIWQTPAEFGASSMFFQIPLA